MSSLRKQTDNGWWEIKNSKIFGAECPYGEVKTYFLTPEELAKYKKEEADNMPGPKSKIPAPAKEYIENLIIKHHGKIDLMAKDEHVSWPVMNGWVKEYDLKTMAETEARKHVVLSKLNGKYQPVLLQKMIDEGQSRENIAKYFDIKQSDVDILISGLGTSLEMEPVEPSLDQLEKLEEVKRLAQTKGEAEPGPIQPTNQDERTCRVCGCTETNACVGGCWWVEEDLCSSCAYVLQDGTEEEAELLRKQKEAAGEKAGPWIVMDWKDEHQFKTEEEAVNHILNNYSVNDAKNVMLLKVVPFVLMAKVVTGNKVD